MHDEPDVGTVDPHPERDGRHHDVDRFVQERVLVPVPRRVVQAGMIGQRADAFVGQRRCQLVDIPPRQAIDDAGLAGVAAKDCQQLPPEMGARQDPIGQVGPIERADQHRRIDEAKLVADVAPDARRRRRRVGVQRDAGERLPQAGEQAVLRPEVVPPLADAVRLVHRDIGDAARRQQRAEAVGRLADGRSGAT